MSEYRACSPYTAHSDFVVWASGSKDVGISVVEKRANGAPKDPRIVFVSTTQARNLINALSKALREAEQ